VSEISIEPSSGDIDNTVAVMGEDWKMWMDALKQKIYSSGATLHSYIGPSLTEAVYRKGTIGRAKDDLSCITDSLADINGKLMFL
jgi:enoyl-[acyl-carrier protein] reductase/trans-2-enoyl-CoA reductase (NAD+)